MEKRIKIPLTQGKVTFISDQDFNLISKYKWHYRKSGKTNGKNGYAEHTISDKKSYDKVTRQYKKRINLFIHNLIMNPPKGKVVDHINRNGLDNTRSNLRLVSISQNYHNFPTRKSKSGYKGVYFHKARVATKPWECCMTINGKQKSLGVFKTAKEAAMFYNKKAKELYGDVAILNKI